jgi:hypothetical protein
MAATFVAKRFAFANSNTRYDVQNDPSIISVDHAPTEFRAPTLGQTFFESANDPFKKARGKRIYKPADLWHEVMSYGGDVEAETARQFVNDFLSGVFANDVDITDPRAGQDLKSLGFEMVITLYEKISQSDAKGNSLYLQQLNKALDLPDTFYEKRVQPMANFYGENQKAWMQTKWEEARRDGRISADHSLRFEDAMAEELTSPPIWSASDAKRRIQMLQFLCDSYSDYVKEPRIRVGLFNGQPGLKGFYSPPQPGKPEVIGLNVNELSNFQQCVGIIMHERQHTSQARLSEAYEAGLIKKGDTDYVAARVFSANGAAGGYISGDKEAGHRGYRFQPMEQDAHNAGSVAEYMVFKTYAREPGIYTERHVRPDKAPPSQSLAS